MKIYLREITENTTDIDVTQDEKWVRDAVVRCDEHLDEPLGGPVPRAPKERPIRAHFGINKVDEVVVIAGKLDTSLQLICSRCANTYSFETHPQFTALYCKDPVMAGVAHLQRRGDDKRAAGKPVGQNKGFARHAHDESMDDEESSMSNTEITYIAEDYIDLADVVTEQLQIQIPFQPLCRETCKGVCQTCGADLNVGRCACSKIVKQNAFSALRDFKARS